MSHFKEATHFDQYNGNNARLAQDQKDLAEMEASLKAPEVTKEEKDTEEFKEAYSEVEVKANDETARRHSTAWAQKRFNEAKAAKDALAEVQARNLELERQIAEQVMPRSVEQNKEWSQENPESAAQVSTMIQQNSLQTDDKIRALEAKLANMVTNTEQVAAQTAEDKAFNELTTIVPEAGALFEDADFNSWLAQRPAMEQIINGTLDVASAASVMNTYKFEQTSKTPKEAAKKAEQADIEEAAMSIKSSGNSPENKSSPKIWKGSEIANMSLDEYERREKEIDLAMSEGRWLPQE